MANEYEVLKAAGFSDDEILADAGFESKPQSSLGGLIAGGLSRAIPAYGDEIIAGGTSLVDKLFGDYGTYNQRIDEVRQGVKDFTENVPGGAVTRTGIDIVSALKAPTPGNFQKLGPLARGLIEGGIYGFGEGEGGLTERAKTAGASSLAGGILNKTGDVVAKNIPRMARGLKDKALGITLNDRKTMLKGPAKNVFQETGEHITDKAIKTAERYGVTKAMKPDKVMMNTKDAISGIQKEVNSLIKNADDALDASDSQLMVEFKHLDDYIAKVKTPDRAQLITEADKIKKVIQETAEGTFAGVQDAKVQFNASEFTPETTNQMKKLYNAATRDLKETIESGLDELGNKKLLSSEVIGKIKNLNRDEGHLIALLGKNGKQATGFTRTANAYTSTNPIQKGINFVRTTGGGGLPLMVGAATGHLPEVAAAELLAAYLMSPKGGMAAGNALESLAPLLKDGLSRSLVSGGNSINSLLKIR